MIGCDVALSTVNKDFNMFWSPEEIIKYCQQQKKPVKIIN